MRPVAAAPPASAPVRAVLDSSWPRIKPPELLATLLGDPAALTRTADGILTDEEQAAIRRPPPRNLRNVR